MDFSTSHLSLWNKLSEFVKKVCEGRDITHGHNHMECVANNALKILVGELVDFYPYVEKVITVAWLHDVADYKYDKDGNLKIQVREFVSTLFTDEIGSFEEHYNDCDMIMKIIDLISFSKENNAIKNGNRIDFNKELGSDGAFIRNIVSDADKLEALGKIGFERCVEYGKYHHKEKYGVDISEEYLNQLVKQHADDKLLRLKDEFIYTTTGKRMAEKLHEELVEELNKM